jgi:hypothetical protein
MAVLEVELAKVVLVVSRPHLLLRLREIGAAVLEKPDPVISLALGHVCEQALLNLGDLVSDGLEGRRWHTNGVSVIFQQKLDVLLRACVRLGDGYAECSVEMCNLLCMRGGMRVRELVAVAFYVARAAVRIVRPQLGRHATPAARLGILICTVLAHAASRVAGAAGGIHAAPDLLLCLVGEIPGAVVARLLAAITHADIVALVLALMAEVRQNDRN